MHNSYNNLLVGSMLGFLLFGVVIFGLLVSTGTIHIGEPEKGTSSVQAEATSPLSPQQLSTNTASRAELASFPLTQSTWKSRFNGAGAPAGGGYLAYYFDAEKPTTWKNVSPKKVSSVDVKFAWYLDPVTGKETSTGGVSTIESKSFAGYWIGTFTAPADGKLDLHLSESWAAARVIIDGREIYNGSNNNEVIPLLLPTGTHTLEVEHRNNWHTANFSVSLLPPASTVDDLHAILTIPGVKTWRVSVYESGNQDNRIALSLPKAVVGPVVLYVSSYETVHWDLSGIPAHALDAIVITSYTKAADAVNVPVGTKVFYPTNTDYVGSGTFSTEVSINGSVSSYSPKGVRLPGGSPTDIIH